MFETNDLNTCSTVENTLHHTATTTTTTNSIAHQQHHSTTDAQCARVSS